MPVSFYRSVHNRTIYSTILIAFVIVTRKRKLHDLVWAVAI